MSSACGNHCSYSLHVNPTKTQARSDDVRRLFHLRAIVFRFDVFFFAVLFVVLAGFAVLLLACAFLAEAPACVVDAAEVVLESCADVRWRYSAQQRVRQHEAGGPASTLMPVNLFQRRNSVSETPKRSAIVTSVSPRRTVYRRVCEDGETDSGTGTTSACTPARLSSAWS